MRISQSTKLKNQKGRGKDLNNILSQKHMRNKSQVSSSSSSSANSTLEKHKFSFHNLDLSNVPTIIIDDSDCEEIKTEAITQASIETIVVENEDSRVTENQIEANIGGLQKQEIPSQGSIETDEEFEESVEQIQKGKRTSESNYESQTDSEEGTSVSPPKQLNKRKRAVTQKVTSQTDSEDFCTIPLVDHTDPNMSTIDKTGKVRYRPGARALMEIRVFQRSPKAIMQRAPFRRMVLDIIQKMRLNNKFQVLALTALQVTF